jgi:hypothetical protein
MLMALSDPTRRSTDLKMPKKINTRSIKKALKARSILPTKTQLINLLKFAHLAGVISITKEAVYSLREI